MAANTPRLGLNHVTVVPANFEQTVEDTEMSDESDSDTHEA